MADAKIVLTYDWWVVAGKTVDKYNVYCKWLNLDYLHNKWIKVHNSLLLGCYWMLAIIYSCRGDPGWGTREYLKTWVEEKYAGQMQLLSSFNLTLLSKIFIKLNIIIVKNIKTFYCQLFWLLDPLLIKTLFAFSIASFNARSFCHNCSRIVYFWAGDDHGPWPRLSFIMAQEDDSHLLGVQGPVVTMSIVPVLHWSRLPSAAFSLASPGSIIDY